MGDLQEAGWGERVPGVAVFSAHFPDPCFSPNQHSITEQ